MSQDPDPNPAEESIEEWADEVGVEVDPEDLDVDGVVEDDYGDSDDSDSEK